MPRPAPLEPLLRAPEAQLPGGALLQGPGFSCAVHPIPLAHLNVVRLGAARHLPRVRQAHAHRPSRWCVWRPGPLGATLAAAGYHPRGLRSMEATPRPGPVALVEAGTDAELRAWYQLFCEARGLPVPEADWGRLRGGAHRHFFDPGGDAAGALYVQAEVGFLWGGSTRAGARGRGAWRRLLLGRLALAAALGLGRVFTYAGLTEAPLARMGFVGGRRFEAWEHPGD